MCAICILYEQLMGDHPNGAIRNYAAGEGIFYEGDAITGVHALHYGTVALLKRDPATGSLMTYVAVPDDLLGMPGVMVGSCYINSATALEPVETFFIPREGFLELIRQQPDLILQSMRRLCDRLNFLEEQIDWVERQEDD